MTTPTYTANDLGLAVSIGELKTDVRNVLAGVEEIKGTLGNVVVRLSGLETEHAVTRREASEARREAAEAKVEATSLRGELAEAQRTKDARKPPWTAIAALGVSAFVVAKQYLGF